MFLALCLFVVMCVCACVCKQETWQHVSERNISESLCVRTCSCTTVFVFVYLFVCTRQTTGASEAETKGERVSMNIISPVVSISPSRGPLLEPRQPTGCPLKYI